MGLRRLIQIIQVVSRFHERLTLLPGKPGSMMPEAGSTAELES